MRVGQEPRRCGRSSGCNGGPFFTHYVKVTFFRGTSLRPVPPVASKHKEVRYIDIREDDLDEAPDGDLGEAGGRVARLGRVADCPEALGGVSSLD